MTGQAWKTALVVLVAVATGVLIGGSRLLPGAYGVAEGQSGGVIALVGDEINQTAPIVLVDVPDQTVLIYEYNYQSDEIELTSARTFRYDKRLAEFQTRGVSVQEVRDYVSQQRLP